MERWEGHLYQHVGPVAAYRLLADREVKTISEGPKRVIAALTSPQLPPGTRVSLDGESLRVAGNFKTMAGWVATLEPT